MLKCKSLHKIFSTMPLVNLPTNAAVSKSGKRIYLLAVYYPNFRNCEFLLLTEHANSSNLSPNYQDVYLLLSLCHCHDRFILDPSCLDKVFTVFETKSVNSDFSNCCVIRHSDRIEDVACNAPVHKKQAQEQMVDVDRLVS